MASHVAARPRISNSLPATRIALPAARARVSFPFASPPASLRSTLPPLLSSRKRLEVVGGSAKGFMTQDKAQQGPVDPIKGLGAEVSEMLGGTSVVIVGDSSEANQALANALGPLLRYNTLSTETMIKKYAEVEDIKDFIDSEGLDSLGSVEAAICEQLSTQLRCCTATAGYGGGAAARGDCWRHLFGQVSIWLDQDPDADVANAPQREAYSFAEIQLKAEGKATWTADVAKQFADSALRAIQKLLREDDKLCGKKNCYVKLGCRGDWPILDIDMKEMDIAQKEI